MLVRVMRHLAEVAGAAALVTAAAAGPAEAGVSDGVDRVSLVSCHHFYCQFLDIKSQVVQTPAGVTILKETIESRLVVTPPPTGYFVTTSTTRETHVLKGGDSQVWHMQIKRDSNVPFPYQCRYDVVQVRGDVKFERSLTCDD
jgi:hypothetical protein